MLKKVQALYYKLVGFGYAALGFLLLNSAFSPSLLSVLQATLGT